MGLFDEGTGGLVTYWKSVSAITSRVGAGTSAKIAPDAAREKWTGQFIVYTRGPGGNIHGHLTGTTGARQSIVHVYCWADSRTDADALCEAIKVNTQNASMRGVHGGIIVNWVFVDDPPDDGYDKPVDGSDTKKFWTRVVLRITHSESGGT